MSAISVKINGKAVDLYDSDSNKTFLDRVASTLKLHPNFLEDIDITTLKKGDSLKIDTLINEIQGYEYDTDNIQKNINTLKYLIEKYNKNTPDVVVKLFLSINPLFDREITDEFELIELMPLNQAIQDSDDIDLSIDIVKFLKKDDITRRSPKDDFMKEIKARIVAANEESNALLSLNREFAEMKSVNVDNVEIEKDESDFKLITNIKKSDYSLSSIFSNIVCGENTPFLSYNNLYKVYQDLDNKIPDDWSTTYSEFMILKVCIEDKKYTDCNIIFEGDNLVLITEIKYKNFSHISEDYIQELVRIRLENSFRNFPDFSYTGEKEVNIYETAIMPSQKFDTYILSDIIMNNRIFSRLLAVNESVQTTKKKSGIYVHYFIKNEKGTCNITTLTVDNKDSVRLRIKKAKDQAIANEFIQLVGKLLYIYKKNEKSIIDFYKKYISNFPKEKEKKEVEDVKVTLNKQVPDLFISGYAHKCQYQPVIISDEEVSEYPEERVMKYPIKGEGKPHNYLCNDDGTGYIYIGLRENRLENRNKYKYIPCCFKSDQTKRRGPYSEYFKGEIIEKGPQQNIIITNKLVRNEEYGILPRNIDKLLTTIDDSYEYLRKGMNSTPISFLDCILEGSLDIAEYSGLPQKSKLEILEKQFNKLVNYPYISVASQENPNYTQDDLKMELLAEKRTYMNPARWVKLCETFYKCKIILFTRDRNERDGFITLPNHELVYLQEKYKDQKVILVYEHYGTEIDSSYPRCELIVKWESSQNVDEGTVNYFSYSSAKNIYSFYKNIISQYYYSIFEKNLKTVTMFDLAELNSLKPNYQIIDNYGKARGIVVNDIILLSDPFPPIKAQRYNNNDDSIYRGNDTQKVIDFINKNNLKITSQIEVNNLLLEINVSISNIIFTAKISKLNNLSLVDNLELSIEKDIIEKYPSVNNDLSDNIRLKRLAFILSEYFNYYYSTYINSQDKEANLESIKSFIKKKVKVVNANVNYILSTSPVVSLDVLQNNGFTEGLNGKFLVENNEVLKRLLYALRSQIFNNNSNVINYYKSKEIYNFYKETRHFSENSINIIVKDIADLQKVDNVIYERVHTEKKEFFMENPNIDENNPVLLKEESSRESAFMLSSNWKKYKKVSDYEDPKQLDNRVLYLYKSQFDIKVSKDIIFPDKEITYALKYKKDGENRYLGVINLV